VVSLLTSIKADPASAITMLSRGLSRQFIDLLAKAGIREKQTHQSRGIGRSSQRQAGALSGRSTKCADVGSFSNTMSRFGKFAQYLNPVAKPSYVSLCRGRVIFSDKIADLDKVRFCLSG
jgi:hypothetical protein